jgi:cystathionine beta-lyase
MRSQFDLVVDRSLTNAEKYTARERLFGSSEVIPMWVADMDIATPSFIMDAISSRAKHPIMGYEDLPQTMWQALIDWMYKRHGYKIEREWLFYSHSVVASLGMAVQACSDVGDEIIVQSPIYPPFFSVVSDNHRKVLHNPLHFDGRSYSIDFEHLKSVVSEKTKAILFCSPHNPVGRVWKKEELLELGNFCIAHDLTIISDEVHSDLVYKPHKHTPFASLSLEIEKRCITCVGPGKTFNMSGLAISAIIVPEPKLRQKVQAVYDAMHFAQGNVFGHVAFESAYREGDMWVDELCTYLAQSRDEVEQFCQSYLAKIVPVKLEGTYLLWLNCDALGLNRKGLESFFYEEAKVGLSTGLSFGRNGAGFMRLNIAVPKSLLKEALNQIRSAYERRGY